MYLPHFLLGHQEASIVDTVEECGAGKLAVRCYIRCRQQPHHRRRTGNTWSAMGCSHQTKCRIHSLQKCPWKRNPLHSQKYQELGSRLPPPLLLIIKKKINKKLHTILTIPGEIIFFNNAHTKKLLTFIFALQL